MDPVVLDSVIIGEYQGVLGIWRQAANGFWDFTPLATDELDKVNQSALFYTEAEVTGQILSYGVRISGVNASWGTQTQVGNEFYILASAIYAAPSSKKTQMEVTIWKPSGATIEGYDPDMWPYKTPGSTINFTIRRTAIDAFDIDEAGIWLAELRYVWVS